MDARILLQDLRYYSFNGQHMLIDSRMNKIFKILSWNVRGLGDPSKCSSVLSTIMQTSPAIVLLQEMKLQDIDRAKSFSFLPRSLDQMVSLPSSSSTGGSQLLGIGIFFDVTTLLLPPFSLSVILTYHSESLSFILTNIYEPSSSPSILNSCQLLGISESTQRGRG